MLKASTAGIPDYHLCWDRDARPRGHTANREDLYYMTFDTKTKIWKNVEGEILPMPLAALDPDGKPHILINLGEDIGRITGGPKSVAHYRWDGDNWTGGTSVGPKRGRADISVNSKTDLSLFMSYPDKNGNAVIARRDSTNAGQTFNNGEVLFKHGRGSFAISSLIEDAHPDARMLVTPRTSDKDLKNIYLIGDNGPVKRCCSF